jgi:hypothetical protein
MSQLKLFIKFIMRTAFSKCPKCQAYTVFVFVTYTHKRVFDLSLSRLLSDYFTVGLVTGRYTSTDFIQIDLNLKKWLPTINQDVIYNPSQFSPNLNHPDFCTCFLYCYCFMLCLQPFFLGFVQARFLKICEGQNR